MVVDDELDICLMLKLVLENNGFIVDYYCNPILALNEFKSNFYDLIVLDIKMPDINGLQLYRDEKKRYIQKYVFLQQVKPYLILHTNLFQYILLLENL